MILKWIIFMGMAHLAASSCPCTVDEDNEMSCTPHSIKNFPEDLDGCSFDRAMIDTIQLIQQPLTLLKNHAWIEIKTHTSPSVYSLVD